MVQSGVKAIRQVHVNCNVNIPILTHGAVFALIPQGYRERRLITLYNENTKVLPGYSMYSNILTLTWTLHVRLD